MTQAINEQVNAVWAEGFTNFVQFISEWGLTVLTGFIALLIVFFLSGWYQDRAEEEQHKKEGNERNEAQRKRTAEKWERVRLEEEEKTRQINARFARKKEHGCWTQDERGGIVSERCAECDPERPAPEPVKEDRA